MTPLAGGGSCQADSVFFFPFSYPLRPTDVRAREVLHSCFIMEVTDLRGREQLTESCTAKRDRDQMRRTSFSGQSTLVCSTVTAWVAG